VEEIIWSLGYSRQIITIVKTKRIWGNSLQKIKGKKRNRWIWTNKKKIRNRRDYYWFNGKNKSSKTWSLWGKSGKRWSRCWYRA
jgi:hypothetical protein